MCGRGRGCDGASAGKRGCSGSAAHAALSPTERSRGTARARPVRFPVDSLPAAPWSLQGEEKHHVAVIMSNPEQSKHLETARMKASSASPPRHTPTTAAACEGVPAGGDGQRL